MIYKLISLTIKGHDKLYKLETLNESGLEHSHSKVIRNDT